MGDAADDLAYKEWQENTPWHHELNPRGYKTAQDFVWTTSSGKKIKLSNMETSHIKNCIAMVERQIIDPFDAFGDEHGFDTGYTAQVLHERNERLEETIKVLKTELSNRLLS